jgi:hypothetical protein
VGPEWDEYTWSRGVGRFTRFGPDGNDEVVRESLQPACAEHDGWVPGEAKFVVGVSLVRENRIGINPDGTRHHY